MVCSPQLTALALVLLCAATIMAAPAPATAAGVESFSFPVFDANTTDVLWVATNTTVLQGASLLFQPERPFPEVNVSEGFLVIPKQLDLWRAAAAATGGGASPAREASFNTSFTVASSARPISFVVLLDRFPTFNSPVGLRGDNSSAGSAPNATADGLAAVEVGTVKSYAPESPDVGLNVTVTPAGGAADAAVWIEYDAVAHLLRVYVGAAAGGGTRPAKALLDTRLSLAGQGTAAQTSPVGFFSGQGTTQTAFVGFFAGTVRDIFVGVRDWDLTVDSFDGEKKKKKGTSWWVILIAVLGSVAATIAIVSILVWCFVSRRRARSMEPKL